MSNPNPHDYRPTAASLGSPLLRGCRIGLLGGSFNPAHTGHLEISRTAIQRLRLHAVWWLVSPQNPLKQAAGMASLEDRLASAGDIARHDRKIWVSSLERDLGTRYTVDTLAAIAARASATRFVWLMGADNMAQLPRWRDWIGIFHQMPIAVFARHPYDLSALTGAAAQRFSTARVPSSLSARLIEIAPPAWLFFALRHHPASATAIRAGAAKIDTGPPN